MAARPRVVLLRRADTPDAYVAAFERAGFDTRCVPVLHIEPVNQGRLRARIAAAGRYGGLILTSARAADVLANEDVSAWRGKPAFAVGPRTARKARALGLRAVGEESGTADALATRIAECVPGSPLLFLCGNRRRDTLPDRLRAANIQVEELVVYQTLGEASALAEALRPAPDWLGFFSPSGVEAALELDGISWNSLARAAIGPTTAEALRIAGCPPHAVAAAPTPEALVAAISLASRPLDA